MLSRSFAFDEIHVVARRRANVRDFFIITSGVLVVMLALFSFLLSKSANRIDALHGMLDEQRAHVEAFRLVASPAAARVLEGDFLDDGSFCFSVVDVDGGDVVTCMRRGHR